MLPCEFLHDLKRREVLEGGATIALLYICHFSRRSVCGEWCVVRSGFCFGKFLRKPPKNSVCVVCEMSVLVSEFYYYIKRQGYFTSNARFALFYFFTFHFLSTCYDSWKFPQKTGVFHLFFMLFHHQLHFYPNNPHSRTIPA